MSAQGNFKPTQALDAAAISRSVKRIAHEIVERNNGAANIVLVGVVRRGARLAERLAEAISTAGHKNVVYSSTMQAGLEYMLREARPGDAILTIGAGSVGRVLDQLALLLESRVPG